MSFFSSEHEYNMETQKIKKKSRPLSKDNQIIVLGENLDNA